MVMAIFFSLLIGFPLCLILFGYGIVPLYAGLLYVASGIAASLGVLRIAGRKDPLKRLKRYYALGALAGAGVGFLTHELLATTAFRVDAAWWGALLGGGGGVLYAILSVATERAPKARPNREKEARFMRKLRWFARSGVEPRN